MIKPNDVQRSLPVLVPDTNSASGKRVEWLSIDVDDDLAKLLDSCALPEKEVSPRAEAPAGAVGEALEPCPLCDSPAHFTERDCPPIGSRYGVRCTECDCWCDYRERSKEEAAARWNWRKPMSNLRFELENARAILLKQGYCAAGDHGTGDPEINRIDAALASTPRPQVVGRNTKTLRDGDQVPGMSHAICHACGLGYKCLDADCPNDKPNPMFAALASAATRTGER